MSKFTSISSVASNSIDAARKAVFSKDGLKNVGMTALSTGAFVGLDAGLEALNQDTPSSDENRNGVTDQRLAIARAKVWQWRLTQGDLAGVRRVMYSYGIIEQGDGLAEVVAKYIELNSIDEQTLSLVESI